MRLAWISAHGYLAVAITIFVTGPNDAITIFDAVRIEPFNLSVRRWLSGNNVRHGEEYMSISPTWQLVANIKGKDGNSVSLDHVVNQAIDKMMPMLKEMVEKSIQAAIKAMPLPKDGKDGKDGRDAIAKDGRDALQIDILPAIDESKAYPRGTFAKYHGGTIRAFRDTSVLSDDLEKAGWEVILDGVADITMEQTGERAFFLRTTLTSGKTVQKDFASPVQIYRGVYKRGQEYHRGDTVTWSGSQWHCDKESTTSQPDVGDDWTLAVREGRAGRSGPDRKPPEPPGPIRLT